MKKSLIPVVAFVAGMAVVPSAFAEPAETNVTSWADLKTCLESTEVICKVASDLSGLSVPAGSYATVNGNVTLDLGGYTLGFTDTPAVMKVIEGANLTIEDGTISNNTPSSRFATIVVSGGDSANGTVTPTNLTVAEDATIQGITPILVQQAAPTSKKSEGLTINVAGTLTNNVQATSTASQALSVSGNVQEGAAPVINITGNLTGVNGGIFQAGLANTTINGGVVAGGSGVIIKSGTLTLDGASVEGTGADAASDPSGNGYNPTGAAIQIESNPAYAGNIAITIDDSDLVSEHGNVLQEYKAAGSEGNELKKLVIKGENVNMTAAEGKKVFDLEDGMTPPAIFTINGKDATPKQLAGSNFSTATPPDDPGNDEPGTDEPGTDTPGTDQPGTDQPGTDQPGSTVKPDLNPGLGIGTGIGTGNLLTTINSKPLNNPNTSDPIASYVGLLAVSMLGLGGTFVLRKKIRF